MKREMGTGSREADMVQDDRGIGTSPHRNSSVSAMVDLCCEVKMKEVLIKVCDLNDSPHLCARTQRHEITRRIQVTLQEPFREASAGTTVDPRRQDFKLRSSASRT
jgi:hypothetical protein